MRCPPFRPAQHSLPTPRELVLLEVGMTRLRSPFWAALFVFALAVVVWIGNQSSPVQTQELERVLEIERYPNGPLELVKLSIGTRSVKDQIKQNFKDDQSKWAIDSVKFKEKDDWVKRLSITFRNASDKPIYGLQGCCFSSRWAFR